MLNQNWKLKYEDLKLKFMDSVDVSFRLGYEQGLQAAQLQQAQQQAQQAAMQPGQPGQDPSAMSGSNYPEIPNSSELDQHIGTLESMVGQANQGSPEQVGLEKSLEFMKNIKNHYEMQKAEKTIMAIGKAVRAPFVIGKAATKNLTEDGKKALNMQEKIVEELMKSMEEEEKKVVESIEKTLSFEQLLKS